MSVSKLGQVKGCGQLTRTQTGRRGLTKECAAEGPEMKVVALDADESRVGCCPGDRNRNGLLEAG